MEQSKDFELACRLQAKTFKQASGFGLRCNRAIYTASKLASVETVESYQGQLVPAGTGTGKTTFALSLIAARLLTDPNYTAAFVTPTIEAAQNAYDALKQMLSKDVVAIHSSAHANASEASKRNSAVQQQFAENGPSSRSNLVNARVAICTHAAWLGEGLAGDSHGIRYHITGPRKNTFVDEFPDTLSVQDISASDLVELANEFERHSDTRALAGAITEFAISLRDGTDDKLARYWLPTALTNLDIAAINSYDTHRFCAAGSPDRCSKAIKALRKAALGHAFWTRTGAPKGDSRLGHKRLVTFANIFRPHPDLIILDATADCALAATELNTLAVPKVLYPQVSVSHIAVPRELHGLAATKLNTTNQKLYVNWITEVVCKQSDISGPFLVVVHKSVEDQVCAALQSKLNEADQVLVTHWGCDVGSNSYRDCKTVFLFSEFYQPRHVYLARALGIKSDR